ncbi:MAG: hypothetical protein Q8Q10_04475 [bacterium]|nr:hypothetical protein [bacterium]
MSDNALETFSNEQNHEKYKIFSKRAGANLPVFKDIKDGAENYMRADSLVEDELRKIVKRENIAISKADLDSLIRVSFAENGAHFVATLEGLYIDTGARVFYSPMTVSSLRGKEEVSGEWLTPDLVDGFRKRFPFDQLIKAYDEAFVAVQEKSIEKILDKQFGDKENKQ